MIRNFFGWLNEPLGRIGELIAALSLFSLVAFGIYSTQYPPNNQLSLRIRSMSVWGCNVCIVIRAPCADPSPGLPTLTKCWACHQQIAKTDTSPKLAVLKDYVLNNKEIAWVPVAQVPDFVHFTHRPHIAAGLNCERCHGDMSNAEIAENPQVMNMGWCLNCHRERRGMTKKN